VEPGYGVDLFEDDYLLLLAADLRMDPALRPRPVSSVAFAYLGNTPLNVYGGIFDNPPGFFFYLHAEQFVFVFVFLFFCFLWPGAVGGSVKEGRIVCTIETQ
jgi:hypothetical protein